MRRATRVSEAHRDLQWAARVGPEPPEWLRRLQRHALAVARQRDPRPACEGATKHAWCRIAQLLGDIRRVHRTARPTVSSASIGALNPDGTSKATTVAPSSRVVTFICSCVSAHATFASVLWTAAPSVEVEREIYLAQVRMPADFGIIQQTLTRSAMSSSTPPSVDHHTDAMPEAEKVKDIDRMHDSSGSPTDHE